MCEDDFKSIGFQKFEERFMLHKEYKNFNQGMYHAYYIYLMTTIANKM